MSETSKLHLVKPDGTDLPDLDTLNSNYDLLDTEIWARAKTFNGETVGNDGGFHVNKIPFAENLQTSAIQTSDGTYVARTTGGNASVEDSFAWLRQIKGNSLHTGFIPEELTLSVVEVDVEDREDIGASITNLEYFYDIVDSDADFTLVYDSTGSTWKRSGEAIEIGDYGITVTGTPLNGDSIVIHYIKEVRGTIYVSNPQSFISTNWNLFDDTTGQARVLKYSDQYGYCIKGGFASIRFSTTPGGTSTQIYPDASTGLFSVPSDGYITVVGYSDTNPVAIWATWSDWVNGYRWDPAKSEQGEYQAHSEEIIDFSSVMETYFQNGLMQVGETADEINLMDDNDQYIVQRITRVDYSEAALEEIKLTGRDYDYDENYIYYVSASETTVHLGTVGIHIENVYHSDDHGQEIFTYNMGDTPQAAYAKCEYSASLKNKLERDVLTISSQTLSSAQKQTVMEYTGVNGELTSLETRITTKLDKLFQTKAYSFGYSLAASTAKSFTANDFGISAIQGYTPVAILYFTTGANYVHPYMINIAATGTNNVMSVRNMTSSAQNTKTVRLTILYVKSDFL